MWHSPVTKQGKPRPAFPRLEGIHSLHWERSKISQVDSCGCSQLCKNQQPPAMNLLPGRHFRCVSATCYYPLASCCHCWLEKGVCLLSCQFLLFSQGSGWNCVVDLQFSFKFFFNLPHLSYLCLVSRFPWNMPHQSPGQRGFPVTFQTLGCQEQEWWLMPRGCHSSTGT